MDARYDPAAAEGPIFALWEAPACSPEGRRAASRYAIALPPPNVTGELHMGHALNGSSRTR